MNAYEYPSYEGALRAGGANVLTFQQFGSYQGEWYAKVEFDGRTGWVSGSHGSCSGCDAIEADFDTYSMRCERTNTPTAIIRNASSATRPARHSMSALPRSAAVTLTTSSLKRKWKRKRPRATNGTTKARKRSRG